MAKQVAIVEFGRARVKISVWQSGGGRLPRRTTSESIEYNSASVADVISVARVIGNDYNDEAGTEVVVVGTDPLRKSEETSDVLRSIFGSEMLVLSAQDEGRLFMEAVRYEADVDVSSLVAIDVGGGSLQICTESMVVSLPYGTFSMEEAFSLPHGAALEAYIYPSACIASAASTLLRAEKATTLVAGSNFVRSFFDSANTYFGYARSRGAYSLNDVADLLRDVAAADASEFGDIFPELPNYIYGADKLLLAVIAVAAAVGAEEVVPTNVGVSHGLALRTLADVE